MEYSPRKMKELLNNNQFDFKKKFGQNFIVDENIITSIVSKAEITNETLVIEIGPGAGSLSYKLAQHARNLLCYEIDNSLKNILEENLKQFDNVKIKYEDFLSANILEDIKDYNYSQIYIVANLPYYITTPILVKIIESKIPVDKVVVMVQKEVGDRFKAKPGTKEYSSLSVFLGYYFDVSKLIDVSRHVFMPVPNVDSIVVQFKKKEPQPLKNEKMFFELVKRSFTQKRKTLRNNLKGYDLDKIEAVLNNHNFDLSVRAEQLSLQIFIEIANSI